MSDPNRATDILDLLLRQQRIDRPWSDYQVGTKALAVMGGHWTKTEHGWQWNGGSTFPTPGGDACSVVLP